MHLDELAGRRRVQQLENVDRQIKTIGRDAEATGNRASRSFQNLHQQVRNTDQGLGRLRVGLRNVGSEVWRLARPAGLIYGLGTALGVAGQGIGALGGGIVGLLPRLVDLGGALAPMIAGFTGLGASMLTAKLAFSGIGAAVQGTKGAMQQLTPTAARLAVQLRQLRPLLREFRTSALGGSGGLAAGVSNAIGRLRSPQVRGFVNQVLSQTSTNLGGIVSNAAARLTTPGALADLGGITQQGNVVVRQMASGLLNVGDALRHVAVAARPFTMWLSNTVTGWTRNLAVMARNGRESGRLSTFFDRTRVSLTNLGHILSNVWGTFRNLGRDARPLGDELWQAAERTTAGWERVTSTFGSRVGLTREFTQMGHAIRSIFDLVGELGKALFHMGSSPVLGHTVDGLRQMVPALERILNGMANAFGPAMAQTLTSFANVVSDLTGVTGPFTLLLTTLNKTFQLLDAILNIAKPVRSVFVEAFSLAVMARFLSKLGLIEIGWRRVAVAAGQAAAAEGAAMAGGGAGGFGIGLGPVFGGRGGRGGPGLFARIGGRLRGSPGMIGPATRGEALAARFGAVEGGVFGAGARAGLLTRGGLAAGGMALGRGALGIASKFALPLLAIQGAFGALTAQRSGSFGHQALQTGFGAVNAGTAGILGHFFHGLDSPEQRAARAAAGLQGTMASSLSTDAREFQGTQRLTHQIIDLQRLASQVQDRQTQASQQLLASINQEIAARRAVRAQLTAEAMQRGQQRGSTVLGALNSIYRTQGPAAAESAAFATLGRYAGTGVQARTTRNTIEQGILRANPGDPTVAARIQAAEAAQGRTVRVSNGGIYVGSQYERDVLKSRATLPGANVARIRQNMVASLIAYGLTPAQARADVDRWIANGMRGDLLTAAQQRSVPGWRYPPHATDVPRPAAVHDPRTASSPAGMVPGAFRNARGGRIPGVGLADTMPVGGMAAPGELIVNRHTEARVNQMLGRAGHTLGGLVGSETRRHSDVFATGGRARGGGVYPLRSKGSLIGTPGVGTHSFLVPPNNWESDNAVDLGTPVGTPVIAVGGGTIGSQIGSLGSSDPRMAGLRLHLQTAGNEFYYAHLSRLAVHAGQRVRAGGLLGWSGAANGVAHLHFAERSGNPMGLLGLPTTTAPYAAGGGARAGRKAGAVGGRSITNLTALNRIGSATNALMGLTGGGGGGGGGAAAVSAGTPTGPAGTAGSASTATGSTQAIGRQMMTARWPASEWGALQQLWSNESGWSPTAMNPSSQAQGIPQFLPMPGRTTPPGFPSTPPVNARSQIGWGLNYIAGRYGSPTAALKAWQGRSPHWYAHGGRTPRWGGWKAAGVNGVYSSPTVIGVGERGAERVRVTPAGTPAGAGSRIEANFYIQGGEPGRVQREVEAALRTFAQHLDNHPIDGED